VAIDGVLVDPSAATVSVYDRGFLYGDSVFETVRTYGGVPFRLKEHVERLAWSAERVLMNLPLTVADTVGEVGRVVREILERAPEGTELVARIMITRGEGPLGLDPTEATHPRRVMLVQRLSPLSSASYTKGVTVATFATFRPSDVARGAKVGNYLESILAIRHARSAGAHEALIVTGDGHVVEGTTSNVFAIVGGDLLTPPAYESLLPGITRALVIEAAPDAGLTAVERRLSPEDLASADEVLLTSTVRELLPVVGIDGHVVGTGRPGPRTRALHEAFRRREGIVGPAPWE
jgi:branched-chain amino acid aminotransferase